MRVIWVAAWLMAIPQLQRAGEPRVPARRPPRVSTATEPLATSPASQTVGPRFDDIMQVPGRRQTRAWVRARNHRNKASSCSSSPRHCTEPSHLASRCSPHPLSTKSSPRGRSNPSTRGLHSPPDDESNTPAHCFHATRNHRAALLTGWTAARRERQSRSHASSAPPMGAAW